MLQVQLYIRTYNINIIIYITMHSNWKVDGAVPTYWFIKTLCQRTNWYLYHLSFGRVKVRPGSSLMVREERFCQQAMQLCVVKVIVPFYWPMWADRSEGDASAVCSPLIGRSCFRQAFQVALWTSSLSLAIHISGWVRHEASQPEKCLNKASHPYWADSSATKPAVSSIGSFPSRSI